MSGIYHTEDTERQKPSDANLRPQASGRSIKTENQEGTWSASRPEMLWVAKEQF